MNPSRRFCILLLALASAAPVTRALAAPAEKRPDIELPPGAAFDRARALYRSGAFEACVESYEQLFSHGTDFPEEVTAETVESARMYFSACLLALGRAEEAEAQMRSAINENPQMGSPDPVVFPSQVLDLFFKVRHQFQQKIEEKIREEQERVEAEQRQRQQKEQRERERVAELERLAAQEELIHRNTRWMAAIPFGVGQFQNGDDALGTVFLISESLLLATTISAVSIQLDAYSRSGKLRDSRPAQRVIDTAYDVHLFAGAAFLLTAGAGVLEAQLSFVPEERLGSRTRKPPKAARSGVEIQPAIQPGSSGTWVGVMGRF